MNKAYKRPSLFPPMLCLNTSTTTTHSHAEVLAVWDETIRRVQDEVSK